MATIVEIASRGYWSSAVFDNGPRIGARRIRIDGKFATEAAATARAVAVIAEGRPDIATFIHQASAKPSISYNLSSADLDDLGRALAAMEKQPV